mgnify:FL=1
MALPTKTKTWNAAVLRQNPTGDTREMARNIWYFIKDTLLTAGWTVLNSCDASTYGAGDKWTDATKLNWHWSSAPFSWITLAAPAGLSADLELCIACSNTAGVWVGAHSSLKIYWSQSAGFTGGNTTTRPTATDELALRDGVYNNDSGRWTNGDEQVQNVIYTVNIAYSNDGDFRFALYEGGGIHILTLLLEEGENFVGADWATPPIVGFCWRFGSWGQLNDATYIRVRMNGNNTNVYGATLGYISAMIGQNQVLVNEVGDGGWPLDEIVLFSSTAGRRGKFGKLVDLYYTSDGVSNGSTFPSDGSRQWVKFGCLVFAWDGTPGVPGTAPDIG